MTWGPRESVDRSNSVVPSSTSRVSRGLRSRYASSRERDFLRGRRHPHVSVALAGSTLNSGLKHAHWQIRKDAGGHPAAKMSVVL